MEIDPQLKSQLFGALSGEIRNMIYAEFWAVSGHRQHVFEAVGGRMSHFPCAMHAGEDDYRNEAFDEVWYRAQTKRPRAVVRSTIWAHRMSSSWNDHWRCEEAMMEARAQGKSAGTLFLPVILTCRRMKEECLPMLYRSTTLILTSLPLSHRLLVSSPSPYICHLRSLDLSLSITFTSLHNHNSSKTTTTTIPPSRSISSGPTYAWRSPTWPTSRVSPTSRCD
ncbi:hypothetical protein BX600DRAFT_28834 [Xylariales sp. PMI_506]|nr:hypothetical protein BX600DRAFT_28834 [Xylariales sp. PMI_506]